VESSSDPECEKPYVEPNYMEFFAILIEAWERRKIDEHTHYLLQSVRLLSVCSERVANPQIIPRRLGICQESLKLSRNFLWIKRIQYEEDADDSEVELPIRDAKKDDQFRLQIRIDF
jgi:hypothetical protein